jgi:hypothetical protein
VCRPDALRVCQIRNRPADPQDPIASPSAEAEAVHGGFEKRRSTNIQRTMLPQLGAFELSVQPRSAKTPALLSPRLADSIANR